MLTLVLAARTDFLFATLLVLYHVRFGKIPRERKFAGVSCIRLFFLFNESWNEIKDEKRKRIIGVSVETKKKIPSVRLTTMHFLRRMSTSSDLSIFVRMNFTLDLQVWKKTFDKRLVSSCLTRTPFMSEDGASLIYSWRVVSIFFYKVTRGSWWIHLKLSSNCTTVIQNKYSDAK